MLARTLQFTCRLARPAVILHAKDVRTIKRWVAPTLRALYNREKRVGPKPPEPRSSYLEWNYEAEIFAFGKRFGEEFQPETLKQAFLNTAPVEEDAENNRPLINKGERLIDLSLSKYFESLPKDVGESLKLHLMSDEILAHVSKHMGTQELIVSAEYPPSQEVFANTFRAIVAVLPEGRVDNFIKDFLVVQLSGKDICDIWEPKEPYNYLVKLLQQRGVEDVEPRLCNESASSTVLANYRVGLYSEKKLLGSGWGESVQIAKQVAALNAIRNIYNFKHIDLI